MLTIYGRDYSSNVQLVMWAVGELGRKYQRLDYGHVFGGTDTPEYRAMNPMGLVPVLQDGDVTMFESAAILRYLASRYGDAVFWPGDRDLRARLDVWAEWGKNTFATAVNRLFHACIVTPPSKRDPAGIASAAAEVRRLAPMLDKRLAAGPWLAGDDFTFADIAVGYILHRYYLLPFERPETPSLDAYSARLQQRPAYREHAMKGFDQMRGRD
jgi:glutathione S-transferase